MAKTAREQIGVDLPEPALREQPPAEQPDAAQPEAPDRPEWLPEAFDSPEALAEAYAESRNKIREQGTRLNQLEQAFQQYQQQPEQPEEPEQPDFDDWNEQMLEAYEQNPLQTMAYLAQQAAAAQWQQAQRQWEKQQQPAMYAQNEMMAAHADQAMEATYPDWVEMKGMVAGAIQRDPSLLTPEDASSLQSTVKALDRAYKLAKYEAVFAAQQDVPEGQPLPAGVTPLHQGGQPMLTQQDLARIEKMRAQTLQGASGRPDAQSLADARLEAMKAAWEGSSYAAHRGS